MARHKATKHFGEGSRTPMQKEDLARLNAELRPMGWMADNVSGLTKHLERTVRCDAALDSKSIARESDIEPACARAFCKKYGLNVLGQWCVKHDDYLRYEANGVLDEFVAEWVARRRGT